MPSATLFECQFLTSDVAFASYKVPIIHWSTVLEERFAPMLKHCWGDIFEKGLHNIYRK